MLSMSRLHSEQTASINDNHHSINIQWNGHTLYVISIYLYNHKNADGEYLEAYNGKG